MCDIEYSWGSGDGGGRCESPRRWAAATSHPRLSLEGMSLLESDAIGAAYPGKSPGLRFERMCCFEKMAMCTPRGIPPNAPLYTA